MIRLIEVLFIVLLFKTYRDYWDRNKDYPLETIAFMFEIVFIYDLCAFIHPYISRFIGSL